MRSILLGVSFGLFVCAFIAGWMHDYPNAAYLMAFACYVRMGASEAKERAA